MHTIQELYKINNHDIYNTINSYINQFPSKPQYVRKPILNTSNPSKEEINIYLQKLNEYELAFKKYEEDLKEYNEITKDRHTNIQNFIEDISGLHSNNLTDSHKENIISFVNDEKSHESWYERCIFMGKLVDIFN